MAMAKPVWRKGIWATGDQLDAGLAADRHDLLGIC